MKNYIYILLTLIACLLTACYPKYQAELARAEQLWEAQPDSALSILNTINGKRIYNNAEHAHYALLYTMALDKNGIDSQNSSDSLISIATDYYAKHGADSIKALAYYYRGRVYENANNTEQSIIYLTLAAKRVPNNSYYTMGLINSHLADRYQDQRDFDKAINHYTISAEAFGKAGSYFNQAITYSKLGLCYSIKDNFAEALQNKYKALSIFIKCNNVDMILLESKNIVSTKLNRGDAPLVLKSELFALFDKYNNGKVPANALSLITNIYVKMQDADKAKHYLDLYIKHNNINVANSLYVNTMLGNIEQAKGNYKKALHYENISDAIIDSIHTNRINKSIENISERYQNEKLKNELLEKQHSHIINNIIIAALAFIALFFIALSYILRQQYLYNKLHYQIKAKELEEVSNKLNAFIASIKNETDNLMDIEETVLIIAKFLNKNSIDKTSNTKHVNGFVDELRTLAKSGKLHAQLKYIANKKYNGFIDYLVDKYKLLPSEANVCAMICLGFPNTLIREILFHKSNQPLFTYRKNIRAKFNLEKPDSLELFLKQGMKNNK